MCCIFLAKIDTWKVKIKLFTNFNALESRVMFSLQVYRLGEPLAPPESPGNGFPDLLMRMIEQYDKSC